MRRSCALVLFDLPSAKTLNPSRHFASTFMQTDLFAFERIAVNTEYI